MKITGVEGTFFLLPSERRGQRRQALVRIQVSAISLCSATIRIDKFLKHLPLPDRRSSRPDECFDRIALRRQCSLIPTFLGITSGLPTIRSGCKIEC